MNMNAKKNSLASFILFTILLSQCTNKPVPNTVKFSPTDPFIKTIVANQVYNIDGKQDNIVEGENGTLLICPKGCFKNANGDVVLTDVKIELAEALKREDMLLSNLTTTSDGKQLETGGMIYFNATANGEQLTIDEDNPVRIEIPTTKKKPEMMVYEGIRDSNGNMNWVNPTELDHALVTVDINSLDFLPPGFRTAVNNGMPYRGYQIATAELTDSLYYSLEPLSSLSVQASPAPESRMMEYVEPNDGSKRVIHNEPIENPSHTHDAVHHDVPVDTNSGINPLSIKVIKSEKYQHTFIATKEFEKRLKVIFNTCNNAVLEVYINNLDKNLYEVDEMAASILGSGKFYDEFIQFSKQKLTKVKEADKYAELLKGYYQQRLNEVTAQLAKEKEKLEKVLKEKSKEAQKVVDDYKKLLFKREAHRMETYGFNWTKTGWINIDIGTMPKDYDEQPLEIMITNSGEFDQVYTYVVYTSIASLYRLNTTDNKHFFAGNETSKTMLMPKKKLGIAIAIGYKNDTPSFAMEEFETGSEPNFSLTLLPSTIEQVKAAIRTYDNYSEENSISVDLEFMATFYKEEQRNKVLQEEYAFFTQLRAVAFPCYKQAISGEVLFYNNCTPCHTATNERVVGPGLASATKKYSKEWLYKWTTNATALIRSGDKQAVKIYEEYNQSVQTTFNFTQEEVTAIYEFIDEYNGK
ncbi:MAG: hypothetical protein EAY81_00725 [Bacteroidetes bacterium]|nr:MAG: hypothetical protein EAY81_00725 [Bacteroidota bacterium]